MAPVRLRGHLATDPGRTAAPARPLVRRLGRTRGQRGRPDGAERGGRRTIRSRTTPGAHATASGVAHPFVQLDARLGRWLAAPPTACPATPSCRGSSIRGHGASERMVVSPGREELGHHAHAWGAVGSSVVAGTSSPGMKTGNAGRSRPCCRVPKNTGFGCCRRVESRRRALHTLNGSGNVAALAPQAESDDRCQQDHDQRDGEGNDDREDRRHETCEGFSR